MARARNVKPAFFKNEVLATCSPMARLLFVGLWTLADREGRMEYRPLKIKAEIFPFDSCDVPKLVSELSVQTPGLEPLVVVYQSGCSRYLWLPGFHRHQNPHKNEPNSCFPAPPCNESSNYQSDTENGCTTRADSLLLNPDSGILNPESPLPAARAAERFSDFWKRWPKGSRKRGRTKCEKHWRANRLDAKADEVMAGLARWLASDEWERGFVPLPQSWLNDQGWEAEPEPAASSGSGLVASGPVSEAKAREILGLEAAA